MSPEYFESAEISDVGRKRKNNEDACLRIPERGIYCVADGMGGEAGGDLASETIVTTIQEIFSKAPTEEDASLSQRIALFRRSANEASRWIKNFAEEKAVGQMGSTLVGLVFDPRTPARAVGLHAGDSRLYSYRQGQLKQITSDHSAVAVLAAKLGVDPSTIPAKYQNELSRAVGLSEVVELEKTPVEVASGDLFLICSDGLSRMLPDPVITKILKENEQSAITITAQKLIAEANEAGGKDNVTVVLVKVGDLTNAPKVVEGDDEEDEERTVAATEAATVAYNPVAATPPATAGKRDTHDSGDVHGDTPMTPVTSDSSTHAPTTPATPIISTPPQPAPVDPKPISPPPAAPTSKPVEIKLPSTPEKLPTPPEIKKSEAILPSDQKKSNKLGLIIGLVVLLAAGAGIWYFTTNQPKISQPAKVVAPRLTNPPIAVVPVVKTLPPTNSMAVNPDLAAYQTALKNAQAAYNLRDYKTAIAQADAALQKAPNDSSAAKLKADAEVQVKRIDDFHDAMTKGQSAFDNHDFNIALAEATHALQIYPGEVTATKLRDNAQNQLAEAEQTHKYQTILAAGQAALKQGDFVAAAAHAKELQALSPNDPAATQIMQQVSLGIDLDSAHKYFDKGDYDTVQQICQSHPDVAAFTPLAVSCRNEQAALSQAQKLLNTGDYSFINTLRGQAFVSKPPFTVLLTQAASEQKILTGLMALKQATNWPALTARLAEPGVAPLANKASFQALAQWAGEMKSLQDANVTYEKMLVWFNVKKPSDRSLQTAEAHKESRLDGSLNDVDRQQYLARVKSLTDVFRRNNLLAENSRSKYLKELSDNIANHE